jgi:enoyl-CoA hydratase/carnithine racemase
MAAGARTWACIGGGVELLLSTDIRAAVSEARFGLPEVKWSIYPFGGSTIKLIQQIGYVHAMDLLLTARLIDAKQAMRLGLVNRLVRRDELMRWAIETAEMIAANSPSAVQAVKRQVSATIADHSFEIDGRVHHDEIARFDAFASLRGNSPRGACTVSSILRPSPRIPPP